MKDDLDERVERALTQAALWDEVKDRLKASGALALRRPAAAPLHRARDRRRAGRRPHGRARVGARSDRHEPIEQLMHELKSQYTFVIVTHNMQQAARVADMTAFFSISRGERGRAVRRADRVRRDREDLHRAVRQADGGLRHRPFRLGAQILVRQCGEGHSERRRDEVEPASRAGRRTRAPARGSARIHRRAGDRAAEERIEPDRAADGDRRRFAHGARSVATAMITNMRKNVRTSSHRNACPCDPLGRVAPSCAWLPSEPRTIAAAASARRSARTQ